MIRLISRLLKDTTLDELRRVADENQQDREWLTTVGQRLQQWRSDDIAALRAMQENPTEESIEAYLQASCRVQHEAVNLENALPVIAKGVSRRCANRVRSPLRSALLAIIARVETEKAAAIKRAVQESEELGLTGNPNDYPAVRQLTSVLQSANGYLSNIESAEWSELSNAVKFCLADVPSGNGTTTRTASSAPSKESDVPSQPGTRLHDFVHPPARG